jgi:hypothetical protein
MFGYDSDAMHFLTDAAGRGTQFSHFFCRRRFHDLR